MIEKGGDHSPSALARTLGEDATTTEIRSVLMNLKRDGLVEKIDEFGGATWRPVRSEVEDRVIDSVERLAEGDRE